MIDGADQCEGADLGGQTCEGLGFDGGTLQCTAGCALDTSSCALCGDGVIGADEACDGAALGGQTCESEGFDGGALACTAGCTLDTSACTDCGDGAVDPGEACDGVDLDGETCASQGFDAGNLACSALCTLDASGCISFACGNGVIDGADQCDGVELGGQTCETLGYDGGTLTCSPGCSFDASACYGCGDGSIDPGEVCDGPDLGGQSCVGLGQGYTGGVLTCDGTCELSLFGCTPVYGIGFCRLQFPLVIDEAPGTNVTVYGRVYVAGLTDQSPVNDPAAAVDAWVGYGPDGSDPAVDPSWTWSPAVPNPGWNGNAFGEPNNDEYQASLVVPAPGSYDYAYRFSGNSGGDFTYCDGDPGGNTTGYAPANAGQMTSAP
jgi:hypothetical protein